MLTFTPSLFFQHATHATIKGALTHDIKELDRLVHRIKTQLYAPIWIKASQIVLQQSVGVLFKKGSSFVQQLRPLITMSSINTVLVVYFDDPAPMGYPFDTINYYWSYQGFSELCKQQGVDFYVVRGPDSYLGNMRFRSGWHFNGEQLETISETIKADIIYVKGGNLVTGPNDVVVNPPELALICKDKWLTYQHFKDLMPYTALINIENWSDVLKQISTNKIVAKPITGMEGNGIVVCDKNTFAYNKLDQQYEPFLAQEFIDSSTGIPGLVKGLHDLRLYLFNGIVKLAVIREPRTGSFLANVAQGGLLTNIELTQIPKWAFACAKNIDQTFKQYTPRIYTIDLMYANNRLYLVELNSRPGFPYKKEWAYYDKLHRYILETLLSAITSEHTV